MNTYTKFLFCGLLAAFCLPLAAQTNTYQAPAPMDDQEKIAVIDSINHLLKENYVFPETAEKMAALLAKRLTEGAYKSILEPDAFAARLTEDLQSVSRDKHLRVNFAPKQIEDIRAREQAPADDNEDYYREQLRRSNFGFQEVKILEGNIGYLDLRGFVDARFGGETATAAMNFLAGTDALIIDLRRNGGGSPSMIQLITSYLYDAEPVHLNNFYWRPEDRNTQTWTLPYVPGKRRPDIPVYVLTSNRTFSAAEEFSYNLQNLKRATLVGETTGGGAHPGGSRIATDRFMVWIPSGRAINPISQTNWEGVGVEPDVKTPQAEALAKAHIMALEKLAEKAETEEEKQRYSWAVLPLQAQQQPVQITPEQLKSYAGHYGPRTLTFENGKLYYQRDGGDKNELTALAEDTFTFEAAPYFRLKILKEKGQVIGLEGQYDDGRRDRSMKDKP